MVIVVADDPQGWSSTQGEEDSRFISRLVHLPTLEPSSPQECKDFTKLAFKLSEQLGIPILIRLTTRVAHQGGIVKLGKITKKDVKPKFEKEIERFNLLPPNTVPKHKELHKKLEKLKTLIRKSNLNIVLNSNPKAKIGIITIGSAFNYVMDALEDLGIKLPVLKLSVSFPIPEKIISSFIRRLREVLIVEELDGIIEDEVRKIAKEVNPKIKIHGKNYLPFAGELREEHVIGALTKITKKRYRFSLKKHREKFEKLKIPKRTPMLCPGCPHRATFYAAKKAAGKDAIFVGDIGCLLLGMPKPLETNNFFFSMGASMGLAHGIKKVTNQKIIAFIGDSTFFHAGIPGLINMTFNKSNPLIIVLDNRITAMTGHQPHPGSGFTATLEETKPLSIHEIAKACGIENVKTLDPYNIKEMENAIKEFLKNDKCSVIVARRECRLMFVRKAKRQGIKLPTFEIDQERCKKCGICVKEFGCPAIKREGNVYYIDKALCNGCGVCAQICPNDAIRPSRLEK
ncbi:MAG TPA: indolepyruvate ferredoxin oxidoreductase subunit alpha [Candidatus Aenigmarchaeota archaeon]|nr:indolepyruvate ferredoxin oxidoreductase subunit alpha [Candidatus Aenigmarchaeota archaeon]